MVEHGHGSGGVGSARVGWEEWVVAVVAWFLGASVLASCAAVAHLRWAGDRRVSLWSGRDRARGRARLWLLGAFGCVGAGLSEAARGGVLSWWQAAPVALCALMLPVAWLTARHNRRQDLRSKAV